MKIGIIREGKVPPDFRVALTPKQCKQIVETYPQVEVFIQKVRSEPTAMNNMQQRAYLLLMIWRIAM